MKLRLFNGGLGGFTRLSANLATAANRQRGFTFVDLLIVVATVLLGIGVVLLPATWGRKAPAARINCVSNLKQVGLAFRLWANDHGENYPMALSSQGTNGGGTMEFNLTGEVWRHFQILSNELNTPRVLVCPKDNRRKVTDWSQFTGNQNLSYFAGLDALETTPKSVLSGDRNINGVVPSPAGVVSISTNDPVGWTRAIHQYTGNVALSDGSAQQINSGDSLTKQFQAAIVSSGRPTHRLALPQ